MNVSAYNTNTDKHNIIPGVNAVVFHTDQGRFLVRATPEGAVEVIAFSNEPDDRLAILPGPPTNGVIITLLRR